MSKRPFGRREAGGGGGDVGNNSRHIQISPLHFFVCFLSLDVPFICRCRPSKASAVWTAVTITAPTCRVRSRRAPRDFTAAAKELTIAPLKCSSFFILSFLFFFCFFFVPSPPPVSSFGLSSGMSPSCHTSSSSSSPCFSLSASFRHRYCFFFFSPLDVSASQRRRQHYGPQ